MKFLTTAALFFALSYSGGAASAEVAGVQFPESASVRGTPVVLNGAGVRYRTIFQVYAAGLYLGKKADNSEAVMATPGPRRLHLQLLRNVDASEMGRLFTRGMEDNVSRGEIGKLIPGLVRMGEIFAEVKKLSPGDTITVDFIPGQGSFVEVNGKLRDRPFLEPEFFNAFLSIWLGNKPADSNLKEALLGRPTAN